MKVRWIGGFGILALLAVHAYTRSVPQLLWTCHVASFAIAIGTLLERTRLIAAGTVFHAGSGIPAYILDLLTADDNSPTSMLVHTVPIAVGLLELWRLGGLPRHANVYAWLLYLGTMVVAYLWSDPARNINLVHEVWPPMASVYTQLWTSWVGNLALAAVTLTLAERGIRWWFERMRRRR